jgi:hypothetical protein
MAQSFLRRSGRVARALLSRGGAGVALSAIDEGFSWNRALKEEGDAIAADFTRGGLYTLGYAVSMSRGAHEKREAWQPALHKERWLHLTPTGIYFEFHPNSNSLFHAGSFLRPDGTVGHFKGSHFRPLFCLGCGRADLRENEDYACIQTFEVPRRILQLVPSDPGWAVSRRKEFAERRKRLKAEERRKAELAAAAKAAREAEAAAREAALRAHYDAIEAQRARETARGPAERATRSVANHVKELALWLLFFFLIAIASRAV